MIIIIKFLMAIKASMSISTLERAALSQRNIEGKIEETMKIDSKKNYVKLKNNDIMGDDSLPSISEHIRSLCDAYVGFYYLSINPDCPTFKVYYDYLESVNECLTNHLDNEYVVKVLQREKSFIEMYAKLLFFFFGLYYRSEENRQTVIAYIEKLLTRKEKDYSNVRFTRRGMIGLNSNWINETIKEISVSPLAR